MSRKSRISPSQDRRIYDAVVRGAPMTELARAYGVSTRTIARHVREESERRRSADGGPVVRVDA